jgi:predicted nuclease of predicted toxin-antitoxin system
MLRYFFDEHLDRAVAEQLLARGIDVLTAQSSGRAGKKIPDVEQLNFATLHNRVVVTHDRDFARLASGQLPHAGIILLQRSLSIGGYVEYLELMARTAESEELQNQLVYCDW